MKAAVWYGYKDIRVENVEEPTVELGFVKVKVVWTGICGTDRHEYVGPNFIPTTKPHRLTGKTAPLILGHEFSGIIEEIGEGVENCKVGDRVTATGTLACGECELCQSGRENICQKLGFLGVSTNGTFAEYVLINHERLYKIPDNVGLREAVLCEPLACGQHALNLMNLNLENLTVVVSGSGIIGISAAIACINGGAKDVYVSGLGPSKKNFIEKIGAHYIDVAEEDLVAIIEKATAGVLADVVFECVGIESSLNSSIKVTKPGGKLMVMGVFEKQPVFPMNDFQEGERTLYTSQAHLNEIGECLHYMSEGKYPYADDMITAVIDLNSIVEKGFEELNKNANEHIKVLIKVSDEPN